MSISEDVAMFGIRPFMTIGDLYRLRDIVPGYHEKIAQIIEDGKYYELLVASLETGDPKLLKLAFGEIRTYQQLAKRILDAIFDSLADGKLDILTSLTDNVLDLEDYLPFEVVHHNIIQRYEEDIGPITDIEEEMHYILDYGSAFPPKNVLDEVFRDAINYIAINYPEVIPNVLEQTKRYPVTFIATHPQFPFTAEQELEAIRQANGKTKQSLIERYNQKYIGLNSDILNDQNRMLMLVNLLGAIGL